MASVNVLVSDHNNACAFFVKSVLKPRGFGVSLAFDADETLAKLATGLFDTVLCDMDPEAESSRTLLREVNRLLPGMPVIVAHDRPACRVEGADVFCGIRKPLRVKHLEEVMDRVKKTVTALENRRRFVRREVNLPAELTADGRTIFCRATNLSAGGMQVETLTRAKVRRGLEALFSQWKKGTILAKLFLGGRRVWQFKTNLAYVERFRFHQPEQVGLSFADLDEDQAEELKSFLFAQA